MDEGLIDRFEDTVRVWVRLGNLRRRRVLRLLGRVENQTGWFELDNRWLGGQGGPFAWQRAKDGEGVFVFIGDMGV